VDEPDNYFHLIGSLAAGFLRRNAISHDPASTFASSLVRFFQSDRANARVSAPFFLAFDTGYDLGLKGDTLISC
jgi:hypothetical protein